MSSNHAGRRLVPGLLMIALTAAVVAVATLQTLHRYETLASGWSWDLAYYNQWFWALVHGHDISVRPLGPWTQEGPSVWTMNYLAPIRLVILPIYAIFPDPRLLLVVQVVALAMIVPAAFALVRSETGSAWAGLSAAVLAAMTPLAWPLILNDFRELQLAPALVIAAMHGVRSRNVRMTLFGVVGMLACRQEFSFVVASLALLPPREPQDAANRYRWARALWVAGLGWLLLGFLVYARWRVNSYAFEIFLDEMAGKKFPLRLTIPSAAEILVLGLGSWSILACLAPRSALLVAPWVLSVAAGRWAMHQIGSEQWHHVRYTAPLVGVGIGAGCIGYSTLWRWFARGSRGTALRTAAWGLALAGMALADLRIHAQMANIPQPISPVEARELQSWIDRVQPDDGVLAHYEVTAPLSSRRFLYSYVMDQNLPRGYPKLGPEIRWVFARAGDIPPDRLAGQGFAVVHDGPHIVVHHRERGPEFVAEMPRQAAAPAERPGGSTSWSETFYLALGNTVILLTNLVWTGLLLAPGFATVLVFGGLPKWGPKSQSPRHSRVGRGLEILDVAMRLGILAGGLLMVAGLALASWTPSQMGAGLVSLAIVGPRALLHLAMRLAP